MKHSVFGSMFGWLWIVISVFVLSGKSANGVDFDPFGTEPSTTDSVSDQANTIGPIIPTIEFNNNDITMAFQIISDATGWSIFPTRDVSRAKVSLWAKQITAGELLDTIVTMAGFIYHRQGNIITVMTYPEYMQHFGLAKTQITPKFAQAQAIASSIKPFLTKLGKSVVHQQTNTLILYDTDANLKILADIIANMDSPAENTIVEVIEIKHSDCEKLAQIVKQVFAPLKGKDKANKDDPRQQPLADNSPKLLAISFNPVSVHPVAHANQLIIVGNDREVLQVKQLIAQIDVANDNMVLEVIVIEYADSEELAKTLQEIFSAKDNDIKTKRQPGSDISPNTNTDSSLAKLPKVISSQLWDVQAPITIHAMGRTNQLIIRGFSSDLDKIRDLINKLDTYIESITKSYQFYYIDAAEIYPGLERVLNTSRGYRSLAESKDNKHFGLTLLEHTNSIILTGPPSAHRIMATTVEMADVPAPYEAGIIRIYKLENADVSEVAVIIDNLLSSEDNKKTDLAEYSKDNSGSNNDSSQDTGTRTGQLIQQVVSRVSVSNATNSVIVQTTARKHHELEKLIEELDKRRQQVLIEAFIVEISTTDDFTLGVELDEINSASILFTFFGLSTIDPTTVDRNIIVTPGGTGALVDPDTIRVLIKALQSDGKVKVLSTPRLLVNDNATGEINRVDEAPITQVNASDTVATTSFAGFVEAGTQFFVTPHISEDDYLRVEYRLIMNTFGTSSSDNSIPPPRRTNSIQSEVTIPNGYTVIVGGLQNTFESESVDKVPLLGDIPLLGLLFQKTTTSKRYTTTYLFMTPTIMKDDDFSDLRMISNQALDEMGAQDEKDDNVE